MDAATDLLAHAALAVPAALLGLALLVGLGLVAYPPLLDRLRALSECRVSLRRATRALDVPRDVDRWFYRHHRLYGAAVVVLALFLLYFLVFGYDRPAWHALFGVAYRDFALIVIDAARIVLWILAVFALLVGTVTWVRPSALRALEARANRWLTTRRLTRGLEREYRGPDAFVTRYPRAVGAVIALTSGLSLLALIMHWGTIIRLAG